VDDGIRTRDIQIHNLSIDPAEYALEIFVGL